MEAIPKYECKSPGWVEVICGSMFSGKTEELLRRVRRAEFARQNIKVFKPEIDNRYGVEEVVSHDSTKTPAIPVKKASEILINLDGKENVVAIDEAQFFDEELIQVSLILANKGVRVIIAGLDIDYLGRPFGPMPELLAVAEFVTKVHAICTQCGGLSHHSHRTVEQDGQVLIGEKDSYTPLCRRCFNLNKNG